MDENLTKKIKNAPQISGCYIFYDKHGYVIYVGKSKSINNRVKSYFTKAASENERTKELVNKICDVKYETTESELDALFNEYRLIKKYKPWHNSQLKADKRRPYLKISNDDPYPALTISEVPDHDSGDYYDFFTDKMDIKDNLELICKVWGLPRCEQKTFNKIKSPCVYHPLDGCIAPCNGKADTHNYMSKVQDLKHLLDGGTSKLAEDLNEKMVEASEDLDFEKALYYKDLRDRILKLKHKTKKRFHLPESGNVIIMIRPHGEKAFSCFFIKDGHVMRRTEFPADPDKKLIQKFSSSFETSGEELIDCDWMAGCLTEVIADKKFVVLPDCEHVSDIVYKEIIDYVNSI